MDFYHGSDLDAIAQDSEEPLLDPSVAHAWLVGTDRIQEIDGGGFSVHVDIDHIGLAGIEIAMGGEPRLLSEVYAEIKEGRPITSPERIKAIAVTIQQRFSETPIEPRTLL